MKKWEIIGKLQDGDIIGLLLKNRGLRTKKEISAFLDPKDPHTLTPEDVGIDKKNLQAGLQRIKKAIAGHESIVVYADYDADGITAGAILWETLHGLGARVMPYIPHRVDEGYGLSVKGIDTVRDMYHPTLIITVDHGITAKDKVAYAKNSGIDVIVTDHHVKPEKLPDCTIIHTTNLCGAGVSWFVSKELTGETNGELVALAAIGTIADMVPLIGPNRSITKFGLSALNRTSRVGLIALFADAGLIPGNLTTYDISHVLAPRLNAMGRLVHAMDALRLLCTHQEDKAISLAKKLGLTNKERQQLTIEMTIHAKALVGEANDRNGSIKKLLFIAHDTFNQGVIGLVAGKLVEEFYRPSIVLAKGEFISKASARSIAGFNIVEAIRVNQDILIDVGGHPMAAGFTVETKQLPELQRRLEAQAEKELDENMLLRTLRIDSEIPLDAATGSLWEKIRTLQPFGFGNPEPVFATTKVTVGDLRLVGAGGKHLKLRIHAYGTTVDAIAFGFGPLYGKLRPDTTIDIAYAVDMNTWNGSRSLQLKIKDIRV